LKNNPLSLSLFHLKLSLSKKKLERESIIIIIIITTCKKMEKMGGSGKRFGVLLCADDSDYVKKMYGGYFGVFVRMLEEEGERWDVYKVARGEFPKDDELIHYDGFVITGSCSDAHGNDTWVSQLLILLKKLNNMNKKILGICFGHQVLI
jgi:hypothetical protein